MTLPGLLKRIAAPILISAAVGRLAARLTGDRIPHRGLVIDTSDPLVRPEIKAALLMRAYESAEWRFVQRHLPIDGDVLELGGSLGIISCAIRRRLAAGRRLVTVEADPRLVPVLRRNLELNRCTDDVVIESAAVAYDGAPTIAFAPGETSASGRIDDPGPTALERIEVRAYTMSDLVERHGLRDFSLVCDVEGVEWQIWRQDRDALARARIIVMETHDAVGFGPWRDLVAELTGSGLFRLVERQGPVVVLARAGAEGR